MCVHTCTHVSEHLSKVLFIEYILLLWQAKQRKCMRNNFKSSNCNNLPFLVLRNIFDHRMFQKMWYQNLRLSRLSICLNDMGASCLFQYFLFSFLISPYFLLEYSHTHISKYYLSFWILWGVGDENWHCIFTSALFQRDLRQCFAPFFALYIFFLSSPWHLASLL